MYALSQAFREKNSEGPQLGSSLILLQGTAVQSAAGDDINQGALATDGEIGQGAKTEDDINQGAFEADDKIGQGAETGDDINQGALETDGKIGQGAETDGKIGQGAGTGGENDQGAETGGYIHQSAHSVNHSQSSTSGGDLGIGGGLEIASTYGDLELTYSTWHPTLMSQSSDPVRDVHRQQLIRHEGTEIKIRGGLAYVVCHWRETRRYVPRSPYDRSVPKGNKQ